MPRWMWSVLALMAFLALLKRMLILMILARLRLRPIGYLTVDEDEVDAWEKELLQGAAGILAAQGFRFHGYARLADPIVPGARGRAMAFFNHPGEPVWASVMASEVPLPQCPFQINYVTCFTNGRMLQTGIAKERLFPVELEYAVEQLVAVADFEAIFAAHKQVAAEMGRAAPAERIGFEALLFLGDKLLADQLDALHARGILVATSDGGSRLTLRGLWMANRGTAASAPIAAKLNLAWRARGETYPLPPEAEAHSFLRIESMGPKLGKYGKGFLIVASLAAFSILSGGDFDWASGAMLLAIVFVHEMGHALAMRWVGYRDVNVFFIPFFGAVAIGRQEKHPAGWKEAVILLAGPVPGLAVGLSIIWFGGMDIPSWVHEAAWTSTMVNGFNLLPIAPLDGGQLMQLILFRRFPRLNKGFLVLSAGAVGALAWWVKSPMLGFFALVLLWGIYQSGKKNAGEAGLAEIRARYPEGRDASGNWDSGMIAEFFAFLRQGKPAHFTEKLARIKGFLAGPADGQPAQPAGVATALGVFVVYVCCLLAPLAWYAMPLLGMFGHGGGKMLKRADLEPAQALVYDGLCADSSVYQITLFSARDTLHLFASTIARADSARVRALADGLSGGEDMKVTVRAPIWGFGGLDSTLPLALRDSSEPESEEDWDYRDSVNSARYDALDTLAKVAWMDSVEKADAMYRRRVDSLGRIEEAMWFSWPVERRKEWLSRWKEKRGQYGSESLGCFKG